MSPENIELLSRITGWITGGILVFFCCYSFIAVNRLHNRKAGKLSKKEDQAFRKALNRTGGAALGSLVFYIAGVAGGNDMVGSIGISLIMSIGAIKGCSEIDEIGPALRFPVMLLSAAYVVIFLEIVTLVLPEYLRDLITWLNGLM